MPLKIKKNHLINIGIFLILLYSLNYINVNASENTPDVKIIDGKLIFVTTDTKATTKTTWETIGFNLTRNESDKGDPTKQKHATIYLTQGEKEEKPSGGKVTVTFTIPEKVVNKALKDSGLDEFIEDEMDIYLHGIFAVKKGNVVTKTNIETLKDIMNAEEWANKDDFADRFDLKITYKRNQEKTYPVSIEYQLFKTSGTETLEIKKFAEMKYLDKFKTDSLKIPNKKNGYDLYRIYYVYLDSAKIKLGNRKTGMNLNFFYNEYLDELKFVRDREFVVKGEGLKIIAMYREFSNKVPSENSEEMEREYEEIDPTGTIGSNSIGNEIFDITQGIPGTESLYASFSTSKYLSSYKFVRKYGTKVYPTRVKQNVTLKYVVIEEKVDEETGEILKVTVPKTENKDVYKTYVVERKYSFWQIESLGVYGLDSATVHTDALSNKITITPKGYNAPTVTYKQSGTEEEHIKEPKVKDVVLTPITLNQSTYPDNDWRSIAEESVKKIKCKNDSLIINSEVIISDEELEEETTKPIPIPDGLELIGDDILYQKNLVIPGEKANGEYLASGTVTYKPIVVINTETPTLEYEIDLNALVVHTPTVADGMIESKISENQMIEPTYGLASLVLDKSFYASLSTFGSHRFIQGYGYKDYSKYIANQQVRFPFDVYSGNSTSGLFIPKNTWTSISLDTQFYLPIWVNEGIYTVDFRSAAINAAPNNATNKTEYLANLEVENYVAIDSVTVEVSGRIYGFNIYDISDYPTWKNVFRLYLNDKLLNGFKYTVGDKDQNGKSNNQNSKYTVALVNGSHPTYKNVGAISSGYLFRYSLTTIGTMKTDKDYIRIKPTFYHVSSNGQDRKEVDIYYTETFNKKTHHFVKLGSELDLQNKKSIHTGSAKLSIPRDELYQTSVLRKISLKELMAQNKKVYTFTNIMIPESLRTYVGFEKNIPGTVIKDDIAKSKQNWYGEYYLPSEIHVVPKGFNINQYLTDFGGGITYREPFWLNKGYIVVNFEIESVKDGNRHLNYINEKNALSGYLNMWEREGFQYQKADYQGSVFNFENGDIVLYYVDKSVSDDWESKGTH